MKVGMIGCGHISDTHIKSWKKAKHGNVNAVFDLNLEIATAKAAKYGISHAYTDIDEIIDKCDVLDVCTPPNSHFEISKKIIDSGKDLLVEKPLVTDIAEWNTLKNMLGDSKSRMSVLHNMKFGLAVQNAKKILDSGKIGDLLRLNRYFLTHPNSDRMLVGDKHWSHKLPGGRWYETMPHELYLTHYFAGWSELKNVSALSTVAALPGAPADEVCFTLQNDNCISTFHYSSNCKLNKRYIELIGTEGVITIDVLSDMLFVDKVTESKIKRAFGLLFLESGWRIVQGIPDRIRYFWQRQKGISPHTRIILQFDEYLNGNAESPTPIEEIDFVVLNCDKVGREIDQRLSAGRL